MCCDFYPILLRIMPESADSCWLGSTLSRVEVIPRQGIWRLHIQYHDHPINIKSLEETRSRLLRNLPFLQDLELHPQPLGVKPVLHKILDQNEALIKDLFWASDREMVAWRIDDKRLNLLATSQEAYDHIIDTQLCTNLAAWIWDNFRLQVLVRALPSWDQVQENSGPAYIVEQKLALLPASGKAGVKKNQNSRRPNLILSRGPLLSYAELEDGLRSAVVEGEVWDKKTSLLRDGRILALYYLSDGRDSVIVKAFLDHGHEDQVGVGDYIRASGSVRYDPNLREIVLVLETWTKVARSKREDREVLKRVELHAHTKMSAMDGLTEVKELIKRAAEWGHTAIAITDHGCTQAFPEAFKAAKGRPLKIIYGVEAYLVDQDKRDKPFHIILLARNATGLKNINKLVSLAYLENYYRLPKIPRQLLQDNREGLLLGSACEAGELYQAVLEGIGSTELERKAAFYDYLEVQPPGNNEFLIREGRVKSEQALHQHIRTIIELGLKLNKPVVATGDVHFLDPEHEIYRRIIQAGQGYEDAEAQAPLYFKTTAEMKAEFNFLDEAEQMALVVHNPALIADLVDSIKPVPDGFFPPTIDKAEEEITALTWERATRIYGSPLPEPIRLRIEKELDSITRHGFSVLYLIAQKLVQKSNEDGYLVGSRGSVGSSLVAYLSGITEVNPLPAHYNCPGCGITRFTEDGGADCGADLPGADCPACGQPFRKDGLDIAFETFLGFDGDKVPDIDLNFSGEYQSRAHQYVEELFGKENVFRAGTISTIAERTAYGFVVKFAEQKQLQLKNSEINRLIKGIAGVRRTTGQHPGGLIVVPRDKDIYEFTALQHPAENKESGIITTHFEYHALESQLVKLDILGHDDPTVIKMLEDLTGIKAATISLSEPSTMKLFSSVEPLELNPEDIGSSVGTMGVPEFNTRFVRQILETTRPSTFAELVRICGLAHGTDVWSNNAQSIIEQGIAPLNQVICNRDDIMTYLIQMGMNKKQAFKIMENVRKGKGLTEEEGALMQNAGIPAWYIDSCQKITYMFPKAHAAAYVTMAFRIAYYKIYHPLAFYASFFSVRAEDVEPETMLKGYEAIRQRLKEIHKMRHEASQKDKKLIPILEVAMEMCARGFRFYPVDIYRSQAHQYLSLEKGLLLPFAALPNVGRSAAEGIVGARGNEAYLSIEDFQTRTRLNKTSMDVMRQYQCFEGLPESNQIQLFA